MGLKADNWIRKMALEHKMIEPFIDGQVREGVISYGVSSYGYDVRVTDEFKIFTNVYSAIVDPKNFAPESFVDFKGDVCIIPPNSFVLARTAEYFRVPRNVITMCIGKSTYARCFRGDTRVALVDGTAPTLEEMARRADEGEMFWGYSIGKNGRLIVTRLDQPRYIGRDSLIEIVLDNDESIFCTPDHNFMLRDGRWAQAADLRPQDSLMPLYRHINHGREMIYQPLTGQLSTKSELMIACQNRHRLNPANPPIPSRRESGHPNLIQEAFQQTPYLGAQQSNHKVKAVHSVAGTHDVYCLTVPEAGNFALESGVFVHNCGLIVNVTPFEPEWEGYVTLEISNTTPLPAKVYAYEGIAQVLFFEGDEPCDISYADRKGKYQKQETIVLPRI